MGRGGGGRGGEELSWECFFYLLKILPDLAGSSLRILELQGGEENLPSLLMPVARILSRVSRYLGQMHVIAILSLLMIIVSCLFQEH